MSVCDVPECPNSGLDGAQTAGAPKGVPRVNVSKQSNETRDRLRVRLHQRKENLRSNKNPSKFAFNPDVTFDSPTIQSKVFTAQVPSNGGATLPKLIATSEPKILAMANKLDPYPRVKIEIDCKVPLKGINYRKNLCSSDTSLFGLPLNPKFKEFINDKESDSTSDDEIEVAHKCELAEARCLATYDDIDELIKFIEGHSLDDKMEGVQKKAAKKARQKEKKENERREKFEAEEKIRKEEAARKREAKRKEEEKVRAELLAQQAAAKKLLKKQKNQQHQQKNNKTSAINIQETASNNKNKKKNKKNNLEMQQQQQHIQEEPELLEQTIPAMVTIKRITENNNASTVTITLKGSTPDQDKLLYTLVNGNGGNHDSDDLKNDKVSNKKDKKKNNNNIQEKELKITLAVDKSFRNQIDKKNHIIEETQTTIQKSKTQLKKEAKLLQQQQNKQSAKIEKSQQKQTKQQQQQQQQPEKTINNIIDIPSLKLPPGITITKVNGPLTNRKANVQNEFQAPIPVNKSGVIVVDTEKLLQQSSGCKKNKKKRKKQALQQAAEQAKKDALAKQQLQQQQQQQQQQQTSMVTLKNPIFANNNTQTKISNSDENMMNINEQATISKGENGMVTIRRPNRNMPQNNDAPISDYMQSRGAPPPQQQQHMQHQQQLQQLQQQQHHQMPPPPPSIEIVTAAQQKSELKSTLSDERKIIKPPNVSPIKPQQNHVNDELTKSLLDSARLNPQTILWGLPGIQITRVNKQIDENKEFQKELDKEQTADVSIIRTKSVNGNFNLERDDWPYESVFAPKDILEDDLDAEERELEAFKRFCQQSVPPIHKEKVAHLNVSDIVLMKKNDIYYN